MPSGKGLSNALSLLKYMEEEDRREKEGSPFFKKAMSDRAEEFLIDQSVLQLAKDMEVFADQNEDALRKVTGPLIGKVQGTTLGNVLAKYDADFQAGRQAHSKFLELFNPEKIKISGVAVPLKEREKDIIPLFGTLEQDYDSFRKSLRDLQFRRIKSLNRTANLFNQQGVDIQRYIMPETREVMQSFMGMTPDQVNQYYYQEHFKDKPWKKIEKKSLKSLQSTQLEQQPRGDDQVYTGQREASPAQAPSLQDMSLDQLLELKNSRMKSRGGNASY